jgi:glyoxylase-like metal-dependent hydrolase (beta-lactamase superfamily II)
MKATRGRKPLSSLLPVCRVVRGSNPLPALPEWLSRVSLPGRGAAVKIRNEETMKPQTFGAIEIHKLLEMDGLAVEPDWLFTNITPEHVAANRDWLGPTMVESGTNRLFLSFHSYVIKTPKLNILVDTCNGNHKQRPSMPAWHMLNLPYLDRLKAIGLAPEDIDIVMCTHLHTDHVGWNTKLEDGRWVPTFPKARYVMSRVDYEYFDGLHRNNPDQPVNRGSFVDSVLPIVEHGRAVMVDAGDTVDIALADEITLERAPGHSIGNLNIFLRSGGRTACLCGDVMHHAIQCADPTLSNFADYDPPQGVATRRALLERCADTDTLLMPAHFPDPSVGRVVSYKDNFRFRLVE